MWAQSIITLIVSIIGIFYYMPGLKDPSVLAYGKNKTTPKRKSIIIAISACGLAFLMSIIEISFLGDAAQNSYVAAKEAASHEGDLEKQSESTTTKVAQNSPEFDISTSEWIDKMNALLAKADMPRLKKRGDRACGVKCTVQYYIDKNITLIVSYSPPISNPRFESIMMFMGSGGTAQGGANMIVTTVFLAQSLVDRGKSEIPSHIRVLFEHILAGKQAEFYLDGVKFYGSQINGVAFVAAEKSY